MNYLIYQITNLINGKIYIGQHRTEHINDCYMGSGTAIKAAIAKYGAENFKKDILCVCASEDEMNRKEAEIVTAEFCERNDTYNIIPGGGNPAPIVSFMSEEAIIEMKRKQSAARKGRHLSVEHRMKISLATRGKKHGAVSDETRAKISKANKGHRHTDDAKIKIGKASKGHLVSEATRKKIADAQRGRKVPEYRKVMISNSLKGRKQSMETRQKRSESVRKSWAIRKGGMK